jgi:hypothetical protein
LLDYIGRYLFTGGGNIFGQKEIEEAMTSNTYLLQAKRDGGSSSALRFTLVGPSRLSSGR